MTFSVENAVTATRRFAVKLGRDVAGNTLAMMAIATIPIAAMAGSGVDMSRAYLVKSRLQQACDAGALAGRRAMTGPTLDSAAEAQARNFFNFNFPAGTMQTTNVVFNPANTVDESGNPSGQITATATATMPTTIMKMFGKQTIVLDVACDAKLEIANTDIMFVLDVTGSMNCSASDTPSTCSNNGNAEKSDARIKALRTAVVSFYDTISAAADSTARLRFGFVPYSSGINVGGLLPSSYLADNHTYQSRVANYTTAVYNPTAGNPVADGSWEIFNGGAGISSSNCTKYGNNQSFSGFTPTSPTSGGGPAPASTWAYSWVSQHGWSGAPDNSGSSKSCRRQRYITTTTYTLAGYQFTNWTYRPESYDASTFKTGSSVTLALGNNGTVPTSGSYNAQQLAALSGTIGVGTTNVSWTKKCVEERDTIAQASFSTIPSNAYDLQIDLTPTSDATKWRPIWENILFDRNTGNNSLADETTSSTRSSESTYCPKAAQKLAVMTHDDVYNYVNASDFKAIGSTYHDFGMIWGARLVSPTGIFASENSSAPNGKPINRHIVFMTDGVLQPSRTLYTAYGLERLDRRISGSSNVPTDSDLTNRHLSRFTALCNAARAKNIAIWVVAYAQTMTTELQNCADPGRAFYAANDAQLQAQFQMIAQRIAKLRLSK